jgi:D-serine deaminase-like pyridoxal phosphate-dependent protein
MAGRYPFSSQDFDRVAHVFAFVAPALALPAPGCRRGIPPWDDPRVTDTPPSDPSGFRIAVPEGIDTPTVLVELDVVQGNITGWAERFAARGVGLRPHTKTSKCIPIIERQVAAGAVGLTVATLGEAEVLADAGFDHLLQAYPLWAGHSDRARRLRDLHERVDFVTGVESVEGAAALGRAMQGSRTPLGVVIEVDPGLHRTGVLPADIAIVARAALDAGLDVRGAFTFGGHGYGLCDAPTLAADDEVRCLEHAQDILRSLDLEPTILSAGSTPTARLSARPPVTDERPGTYVFHDQQQVALGVAGWHEVALAVAATVVASHADGRFVLDAGSKALASDRPAYVNGHGCIPAYPDAELRSLSEHHCVAVTSGPRPAVGEVVAVVPNHACTVVNLADSLTIVRGGEVVDVWAVAARGRNS